MLWYLIAFLAACIGGPGNNNETGDVIDVEDVSNNPSYAFDVTPDGIYLEGVDSVEVNVAVEINGEETACQANLYVESKDGWVEFHFDTDVQTIAVMPKGATIRWSAGDDREGFLTEHKDDEDNLAGLPMHGENFIDEDGETYFVEFFSTWDGATINEPMGITIPLTAYVDGAYKCFAIERYSWDNDEWKLTGTMIELDDDVDHFTDSDGTLVVTGGHILGAVTGTGDVEGAELTISPEKSDRMVYNTHVATNKIGGTYEIEAWAKDIIECSPK